MMPGMSSDLAMSYALDSKVKPPGIAMMIAGGFSAVISLAVLGLYSAFFGFIAMSESQSTRGSSSSQDDTIAFVATITAMIVMMLFSAAMNALIIYGGWNLMRREKYAFALTGVILCFVSGMPCSCLPINTLIFMPIAIWSLIILLEQPVKDSFRT